MLVLLCMVVLMCTDISFLFALFADLLTCIINTIGVSC